MFCFLFLLGSVKTLTACQNTEFKLPLYVGKSVKANFVTVLLSYGLIPCHLATALSRGWHGSTTLLPLHRYCSLSIYTVGANGQSGFCSMALTSSGVRTKEPMDVQCYASRAKTARAHVWDDFPPFAEKHPLPQTGAGGLFSEVGFAHVLHPPPQGLGTTGAENLHTALPSLGRLHPIVGPLGAWTQAGPPSVFVTHCSPLHCDGPPFYHGCTGDIWSYSGCHLFPKGGSFTKLGSVICPFVGCISCSTSCDVTD